jgi:hypothetical protein
MRSNLDTELKLDAARISREGEELSGALDDSIYDFADEFLKPFGGLRYELGAMLVGSELLVRGKLEQDFEAACSRCGKDFDFTVKVKDFTASFEIGDGADFVDITQELRESVLLELPNYPVCSEDCPGVETQEDAPVDTRWAALDAFAEEDHTRENA